MYHVTAMNMREIRDEVCSLWHGHWHEEYLYINVDVLCRLCVCEI